MDSSGSALIAAAKSCEIDVKVDTQEVCSLGTAYWKAHITERKEWSVSLSHLVTMGQFPACLTATGTQLTLKMGVRKPSGTAAPFDGMYGSATVEATTSPAEAVYWHTTANCFVGKVTSGGETKYYRNWLNGEEYTNPSPNIPYTYDSDTYLWTPDNGLVKLTWLTGTAIIQSARVTATRGNLAQGAWSLKGTGALTIEDA